MCARACDSVTAVFVPIDEDVTQIIIQAELKQAVAGGCDRPSVFVVMIDDQTVGFCAVPEFPVMVGAASGAILDTLNVIMIMHHFMEQGSCYFLNGSG